MRHQYETTSTMNQYKGDSENFMSLKTLVKSPLKQLHHRRRKRIKRDPSLNACSEKRKRNNRNNVPKTRTLNPATSTRRADCSIPLLDTTTPSIVSPKISASQPANWHDMKLGVAMSRARQASGRLATPRIVEHMYTLQVCSTPVLSPIPTLLALR